MKRRNFLCLLFFQLIALTLLFPYTPNGRKAAERFFPPGNYGEDALFSEARDVSDALAAEEALKALGPPLSTYYTELSSELPGLSYVDGEPVVTGNMTLEKQYIFPGNLRSFMERGFST